MALDDASLAVVGAAAEAVAALVGPGEAGTAPILACSLSLGCFSSLWRVKWRSDPKMAALFAALSNQPQGSLAPFELKKTDKPWTADLDLMQRRRP